MFRGVGLRRFRGVGFAVSWSFGFRLVKFP